MGKSKTPSQTKPPTRTEFSAELLQLLNKAKIPFRVGGTCALNVYLGASRATKDMDIFCHPGDYPRILKAAEGAGFKADVEDERWIAKIRKGKHYCDVIFGSANMTSTITDDWFKELHHATLWGVRVKLVPPTEMVWSKVFIIDRNKCDINDVCHLILRQNKLMDWKRLLGYMDLHWEVLLIHVLYFRYVYPTARQYIPAWLMDELLARLRTQRTLPAPEKRVCRGRIFSRDDFLIDIEEWGFADLVGDHRKLT